MLISELENIIKEVFKMDLVKSVETVYESESDFLKLVVSIHSLAAEDTIIIHTKFFFKTDKNKINVIENAFHYLYDINCIYRSVDFADTIDLKGKINDIIASNKFGINLQILSEFIDNSPARTLNKYFYDNDITKYSVDSVFYEPKFKIKPCNETTFDFNISVNNKYKIDVIISKLNDKDVENKFIFRFKLLDKVEIVDVKELKNINSLIGSKLIQILDNEL